MIPQRDGPLGMSGAGFELRVLMGEAIVVLFVSHSIEQVREICGKCLWLEHGEVRLFGSVQQVCDAYCK